MPKWSPLDPEADRRLVLGLNEGDEDALATLYDVYADRLYDYCLSIAQEPKAAADIVHDVFIDACRRAPRMRNRSNLRPWLYGAVRRRCLLRARNRGLHWQWSRPPESDVPFDELHTLVERTLERLDVADQEPLLLVLRHDLTGDDLAAVLGLPVWRANSRARKARDRAEAAAAAEIEALCRRCASGLEMEAVQGPVPDGLERILASPGEIVGPLAEHVAGCSECQRRGRIDTVMLLAAPPEAVLPATLRRRVMHTGTDPELAGYRADIAARGGNLTADGMPSQPDVPSALTRRWAFTAGGVVGVLATALVVALLIGPGIPGTGLVSPFQRHPGTEGNPPSAKQSPRDRQQNLGSGPGAGSSGPPAGQAPAIPLPQGRPAAPTLTPTPAPTQNKPLPGKLTVSQSVVQLTLLHRTAEIDLFASQGPVTWIATPSSDLVQLSVQQGTILKDGTQRLTISMRPSLLQLPGQAEVAVSDSTNESLIITVTWGLAAL